MSDNENISVLGILRRGGSLLRLTSARLVCFYLYASTRSTYSTVSFADFADDAVYTIAHLLRRLSGGLTRRAPGVSRVKLYTHPSSQMDQFGFSLRMSLVSIPSYFP